MLDRLGFLRRRDCPLENGIDASFTLAISGGGGGVCFSY